MTRWIASLPMYNVTPQLDGLWRSLLRDAITEAEGTVGPLDATLPDEPIDDLPAFWLRPDLLLSQTCGYPLTHGLGDHVQLVATPIFDIEGCDGPFHRSAVVVGAHAAAQGIATLAACRGLRAACNASDSNSGMNLLRHATSAYARNGHFFGEVLYTGSHLDSVRALARQEADVAAIDCVTFAFMRDALPELTSRVHIIGTTVSTPGLPLIASRTVAMHCIDALRKALDTAFAAQPERAARLRLRGFAQLALDDYAPIVELEREAQARGYPELR